MLTRRVADRAGIAWIGGGWSLAPVWREHLRIAARAHLYMAASAWARATKRVEPPARRAAVAAFVHAAFWRGHEEQYVGAVLRELEAALPAGDVAIIGLDPETSYKARPWHHRVSGLRRHDHAPRTMVEAFASSPQLEPSRGVWRRRRAVFAALAGSQALREAAVIRGCDAWPLIEPALMGLAYLQFPWSAQVMYQLGAALDVIRPSA